MDAFPVFDEYGLNTSVIFDDPNLKNLELDQIERPKGAGQGFQERPWAWDEKVNSLYVSGRPGNVDGTFPNDPSVGYPERIKAIVRHSQDGGDNVKKHMWELGAPKVADYQGDRILSVEVIDPGLYASDRNDSGVFIEFNESVVQDHDSNGTPDFMAAQVTGLHTSALTKFILDDDAVYEDSNITRGLFDECPHAYFLDGRNLNRIVQFDYEEEEKFDGIRLNNVVRYDTDPKKSFIELYIDDRFPGQIYYGNGINSTGTHPALGNRILISELVPGANWANNEPEYKSQFSYTDQNGQYAFGNLEPGMYNLSVFLEDTKLQESTFRPTDNPGVIIKTLYVPGFPELRIESDNLGQAKSGLVWSLESRNLARPTTQLDAEDEFAQEFYNKKLQGVGRGFDPELSAPVLTFIPGARNLGKARPNVTVEVNQDGSLDLTIVDDDNTTTYYPGDYFTILYNNAISGVDFFESFMFSESNNSMDSGTAGSATLGQGSTIPVPL